MREKIRVPKRKDGSDVKSISVKEKGSKVKDIVSDIKDQKKVTAFAESIGGLDRLKDLVSKLEKDASQKAPDRERRSSKQADQGKEAEQAAEKKFWEKRKGELIRQGLLNESVLTRAQALLGFKEDWMVLQARLKKDEYIPKVLEVAQQRRKNAHAALGKEKEGNDPTQILDHGILDILLDQDTAEYLCGTNNLWDKDPAQQNSEIARLNTMRSYLKKETKFSKGLQHDNADQYGEYKVLLQGITKKGAALDFRPQYGENDIGRLGITLTHFRRDFLTILRVLSEHKSELGFASSDIPDDPLAVDRMAAHLYKYSHDRELEHKQQYDYRVQETANSGLTMMDEGYYLGTDTSEQYQRIGQLIRSQTEAAIKKAVHEMKVKESKDVLALIEERNNLLKELFQLEQKMVPANRNKPSEKKSWLSWGKKQDSVAVAESPEETEEQDKHRIRREEVISMLQSDKFKQVREEPKNHIPTENELVKMAIETTL